MRAGGILPNPAIWLVPRAGGFLRYLDHGHGIQIAGKIQSQLLSFWTILLFVYYTKVTLFYFNMDSDESEHSESEFYYNDEISGGIDKENRGEKPSENDENSFTIDVEK